MNKRQFLDALNKELRVLSRSERKVFISYYDELIEDEIESGTLEETAVSVVGDVKQIANDILKNQEGTKIKLSSTRSKVFNIVLLVLGFPLWGSLLLMLALLLLMLALIVLMGYMLIWFIPLILGMGAMLFLGMGATFIYFLPITISQNLAATFVLLGLTALAIGGAGIFGVATLVSSKCLVKGSITFTRLLLRPFHRKEIIT